MTKLTAEAYAIVEGRHADPFRYLGLHNEGDKTVVRAFLPEASKVEAVGEHGDVATLSRIHDAGLFAGALPNGSRRYQLRAQYGDKSVDLDDPYRFPPVLSDFDLYLLGEGTDQRLYDKLGAHPLNLDGVDGVAFVVLAPNARRVSVVGDFNFWDARRHPMRKRGMGYWELFIPHAEAGDHYKFDIIGPNGQHLPLKSDPLAYATEVRPKTASIVFDEASLPRPRPAPVDINARSAPISIYEVHLGSWRRNLAERGRYLTYRELADQLVPYAADMGFTHIEIMPITEYPFDGSWGYQPISLFAPTSRYGTPEHFREFVDACHRAGLGLLLDWVPGHFPNDPHGLGRFDGTALYEHADPRQGTHPDWNTLIYNHGRQEVANFLLSSALYWLREFHVDGIRVDAVASMLYRDYSRREGEWIPNAFGGRENLEAIAFLRRMNELVFTEPGATSVAEESTAWPMVSRPVYVGGLGFGYKWNMGWMHDTLGYISHDPIHRQYHHNNLTFGLLYAFHENFILPLSHDEVVHGKKSLIAKMAGDRWQRFANLRAYFGFMWTHPGKKLLFMGGEFAQEREWNHDIGLDWQLLADPYHEGVRRLLRDLNRLYRGTPALYRLDCEADGFSWIDAANAPESVLSYTRRGRDPHELAVIACNFTPIPRENYRIGVPRPGRYRERVNTDALEYAGSGVGNAGEVHAEPHPMHGHPYSLCLKLPPLGTLVFTAD